MSTLTQIQKDELAIIKTRLESKFAETNNLRNELYTCMDCLSDLTDTDTPMDRVLNMPLDQTRLGHLISTLKAKADKLAPVV